MADRVARARRPIQRSDIVLLVGWAIWPAVPWLLCALLVRWMLRASHRPSG